MQKYFIAVAMLLAIGAGCTGTVDVKPTPNDDQANTGNQLCKDSCGDGVCAEITCQGTGCACAETAESCPQDCGSGNDDNVLGAKDDLIFVTSAGPSGAPTSTSFFVSGKARGTWYFEASFPVKVYDANNKLIGSGVATAQGDWMTEDYVPFEAIIDIPATIQRTDKGTVVLEKDNPSGLPENDNSLTIPVYLVQ